MYQFTNGESAVTLLYELVLKAKETLSLKAVLANKTNVSQHITALQVITKRKETKVGCVLWSGGSSG